MVRRLVAGLLVALLLALPLAGCFSQTPPVSPAGLGTIGVLSESTTLAVDGEGWASYSIFAAAATTVSFQVHPAPGIDRCNPSTDHGATLGRGDFFGVALVNQAVPATTSATPHLMMIGLGLPHIQAFGSVTCGRTAPIPYQPGDDIRLVIGSSVDGFVIYLFVGDDAPTQKRDVALAPHDTLTLHEPDETRTTPSPAAWPAVAQTRTWHVETSGPPRFVIGVAYRDDETVAVIGAHAELTSQELTVTGITPAPAARDATYTPDVGLSGRTTSYEWAYGFANGEAPVVADLARETLAGVVWSGRDEGLIVRELPLTAIAG